MNADLKFFVIFHTPRHTYISGMTTWTDSHLHSRVRRISNVSSNMQFQEFVQDNKVPTFLGTGEITSEEEFRFRQ